MSGERVVLFDLDGTLTRRDTYLAYLIGYLLRHPARLKITFLRLILGARSWAPWRLGPGCSSTGC